MESWFPPRYYRGMRRNPLPASTESKGTNISGIPSHMALARGYIRGLSSPLLAGSGETAGGGGGQMYGAQVGCPLSHAANPSPLAAFCPRARQKWWRGIAGTPVAPETPSGHAYAACGDLNGGTAVGDHKALVPAQPNGIAVAPVAPPRRRAPADRRRRAAGWRTRPTPSGG